ncbi:unnamed protein product [Leptosia nina]|uniref:Nose resistant-to-fluoxetine protein N-terminal domain-containing protein n=1 Tax=Leptosia nina TaxID=320188 RepID=A0AAV1IVS1_9NEOP
MKSSAMEFLYIFLVFIVSFASAALNLQDYPHLYPFDRDLQKNVLDPELCKRQLDYMLNTDTLLLMNFLDAGPRIPKGVLGGNLKSTGHFYECLGISKTVDDINIDGKYCTVNVPLVQNFNFSSVDWPPKLPFNLAAQWVDFYRSLENEDFRDFLNENEVRKSNLRKYLSFAPYVEKLTEISKSDNSVLAALSFQLDLCIPKTCTAGDVINHLFNISALGFEYREGLCRLPNDKHWVTADYLAICVFSLLGFIVVASTLYDLYFLFYLKKSSSQPHILRIFSAYSNLGVLLDLSAKPGSLQCLDGIRAIAMLWVIIGHVFVFIPVVGYNFLDMQEWQTSTKSVWITGAPFTVDTFFMISGLLVVYTSMAKYTSMGLLKNLHVFYLNRLLRMFPLLALMVLFEASLYNRILDGEFWQIAANGAHSCRAFWWCTLFHVQNFVVPEGSCIPVMWYLAIDVQLHILSPLVLFWVLQGNKRSSWAALIISFLVSITIATVYIFLGDIHRNYFTYYYVNILTRSPPFFVGMIVGYFLRAYRSTEFKMSTPLSICITTACLPTFYLIMHVNFLKTSGDWDNTTLSHIVDSFARSIWAAALGWVVFMCVNGYAGPINWFLSLPMWKIPARVSYAISFKFLALTVITVVLSIVLTALIDIPFSIIVKMVLDTVTVKTLKPQPLVCQNGRSKSDGADLKGNINIGFVRDENGKS